MSDIITEVFGCLAMIVLLSGTFSQYLKMKISKRTDDISFMWLTQLWAGTLLLLIYGWCLQSWSLLIFNSIGLIIASDMWVIKYYNQPVIRYRLLSEFFDQKTTQTTDKRGD